MEGARPGFVSARARARQRREMGTLGSGNHYLEVQAVEEILDPATAAAFGLARGEVVVTIHCGSRGLGHQIGSDFLTEMAAGAGASGLVLPDRELACAPIASELGQRYLGAMRAAINCALANREMLGHFARRVFRHFSLAPISGSSPTSPTTPARSRPMRSGTVRGASSSIARVRPAPSAPAIPPFPRRCAPSASRF